MLTQARAPRAAQAQDRRPHALVIGSDFGGLAAAVRLGARGYRVTVLEKLDAPGGRAYVHRHKGFTFDAGPTIITAPFLFEDLWALCGKRLADDVTLRACDPFYRIRFPDGEVFTYSGDAERMAAEVARFSPSDVAGYRAFMKMSAEIFDIGFTKLAHVPFGSLTDMLRIAPALVRLQGYRSVHGVVARFIRDPRLRQVFSFHPLLIGGSPFRATAIYCLIAHLEQKWGVHYAVGGTGRLVQGLVRLIEGQGGTVRYDAEVAEISVRDGAARGVRLAGGEEIGADIVVSNADAAMTLHDLLPAQTPRRWSRAKVARAAHSMGLFVWYFGLKRRYDDVGHHTILLGPRYKELLRDIFERKILAEDFSLYLHRPTAADPSLSPPGCDTFYVLSPVPNLSGGQDWAAIGETYRRAVAKVLDATLLPGFEAEIVTQRVTTPRDFQDRLSSYQGAAFGIEPILTQSAWFRPHNSCGDIRDFFLVGAGTHPGAGVPGVLSSARVLDTVVPEAHVHAR